MNDEKMCPLTKMTCYGRECAWWYNGDCVVPGVARILNIVGIDLFYLRKDAE